MRISRKPFLQKPGRKRKKKAAKKCPLKRKFKVRLFSIREMSIARKKYEVIYNFFFDDRYVDSNRVAAVSGASDLKSAISDANFKSLTGNVKASKADPDDKFYLKQAEHMIRGGNNSTALHFVNTALRFNPNNRVRNPSRVVNH